METKLLRNLLNFSDWLEANNIQKTNGRLRRDVQGNPCYCIQGAMCEYYRQETGNGSWVSGGPMAYDPDNRIKNRAFALGDCGFQATLPREVGIWFGYEGFNDTDRPPAKMGNITTDAESLNDRSEKSLLEIVSHMIEHEYGMTNA